MTIIAQTIGTNSSRDYDWLQDAIAGWLHRTDLGGRIPDFVMLAEQRINRDLETQLQEATAMLTTTPGDSFVARPTSVLSIKALSIPGEGSVDYLSPGQFNDRYARNPDSGIPRHYTRIGGGLRLGPTPNDAYELAAVARLTVPPLADSAGTNWLIEQHSAVYLAAAMCEALTFTKDSAALQTWEAKYATAIAGLNNTDTDSDGPMAVRASGPTP